jgi:predicted SAM-dependent methyltransferase
MPTTTLSEKKHGYHAYDEEKKDNGPKKLHVGCGSTFLPGYIHVDIQPHPHIDIIHDASDLSQVFGESDIDEIYACHILEHFHRHDTLRVLQDWGRVIRKGGVLRLAVPDFDAVMRHYTRYRDLPSVMGLLYGGQTNTYNHHYVTFDMKILTKLLTCAGFGDVARYDTHAFLGDIDDYSKAYLPHKDMTGRLMSLNVVAYNMKTPRYADAEVLKFLRNVHV